MDRTWINLRSREGLEPWTRFQAQYPDLLLAYSWQVEDANLFDATQKPRQSSITTRSLARPLSQSRREFPCSYGPVFGQEDDASPHQAEMYHSGDSTGRVVPADQLPATTAGPRRAVGEPFVTTAPTDPVTRYSAADERNELDAEDEKGDFSGAEKEDPHNRPLTVAELRAYNRRLKRFRQVTRKRAELNSTDDFGNRLTHSQTRYLMSEFAKQPRPDAAHRERLSREIPGFSSRQVQVWFQNR